MKKRSIRFIPINHNILFPLLSYSKKLKISINLDEIKRKLARMYILFNFKKLQSHSENKINKWEENGHVLKQKQKMHSNYLD